MKYKITRNKFFFCIIDEIVFSIPTVYSDPYDEILEKTINGERWMLKVSNWVIEDLRQQLKDGILINNEIIKSKKLSVRFLINQHGVESEKIQFYIINGDIYFESDSIIRRNNILEYLGI